MIARYNPAVDEKDGISPLAKQRAWHGVSQEGMAAAVGVSLRTFRRLERGEVDDPGIRLLHNCAFALGCPLYLIIPSKWFFWTPFQADRPLPPNYGEFLSFPSNVSPATAEEIRLHPLIQKGYRPDGRAPWFQRQLSALAKLEARSGLRRLAIERDSDTEADENGLPLAKARRSRGVTQEELADAIGISIRTYRRLERGQVDDPGVRLLHNSAIALGVDLYEILPEDWFLWTVFSEDAVEPPKWEEFWRPDPESSVPMPYIDHPIVDYVNDDWFNQRIAALFELGHD